MEMQFIQAIDYRNLYLCKTIKDDK
jgi:hypothetical protein